MEIIHGIPTTPFLRPAAVTVGSFDGVHLGHQALLQALREEADRMDGVAVVVTFDPHPRIALGRAEGLILLTDEQEKGELLARYGVDYLVIIPFDRAFADQSGAEFATKILVEKIGAKSLIAGYNHCFGHDRMAASELAIEGLRVVHVEKYEVEGGHVSSSEIRRLIEAQKCSEAEKLLGHTIKLLEP